MRDYFMNISIGGWTSAVAFVLFVGSSIVGLVADHFEQPDIVQLAVVCAMMTGFSWPIILCGKREPALFVGAIPSGAIWFAIGATRVMAIDTELTILTVGGLFLIGISLLLLWVLPAWLFLWLARRCKGRLLREPLTKLIALAGLVAPWWTAAFVLPQTIDADHELVTITASIVIGLVWGKVVSEPFANLVNALRKVPAPSTTQRTRWERLDA